MRYCITVRVPGTDSLRYEMDRLPSYTDSQGQTVDTAGQPFSREERDAVVAAVEAGAVALQVRAIRDMKNATLPNQEIARRATIEVFPLYDSAIAVSDTISGMEDAALDVVPIAAIQEARRLGLISALQESAAIERLAGIYLRKAPSEVQAAMAAVVAP